MKKLILVISFTGFFYSGFSQGYWGSNHETTTTGKVGIGITNPDASLEIHNSSSNSKFLEFQYNDGGTLPRLFLEATSSSYSFRTHYGAGAIDLKFATPYTSEALVIKPSGNIGIGTSNPSSCLGISSTNTSLLELIHIDGGTNPRLFIEASSSNISFRTHYGAGAIDLKFATPYTTDALVIKNDGKIGIGTSNPGSFHLAVEGKIGAREIEVTLQTPWPDFVFSKDYKLKSLPEIEEFIKNEGHLPDVPSAKEIENNNINLGEMDAILLQKIEELTLHLIIMEKNNEELKLKIEELTKLK